MYVGQQNNSNQNQWTDLRVHVHLSHDFEELPQFTTEKTNFVKENWHQSQHHNNHSDELNQTGQVFTLPRTRHCLKTES